MVAAADRFTNVAHIERVRSTFRRYLYLPDPTPLEVTLATVAANRMPGDPVWTLVIGPPSSGKTEIVNSTLGLPHMHAASEITVAGLLSGTGRKDKSRQATGGLLKEVGQFGILVLKDFTTVLSMNRDERSKVLAALREIFDGSWTRRLGTDGGQAFPWKGKLGLIAGCTDEIERHHEVIASMGDRYLRLRMPEVDPKQQGSRSQSNQGREVEMRRQLEAAVTEFFSGVDLSAGVVVQEGDQCRINALASFTALARSSVQRDGYRREIQFVPDSEMPGRLSKCMLSLFGGAIKIGLGGDRAFDLIRQVAFDSVPKVRRQVLREILEYPLYPTIAHLAATARVPEITIRRALEDLRAHKVVESWHTNSNGAGEVWGLSADAAALLDEAGIL